MNSRLKRDAMAGNVDGDDREEHGGARKAGEQGIVSAPEFGLCKANFGDPARPYGRTTSSLPLSFSLSHHAPSRPQKLRPRSCAGRLESARRFSPYFLDFCVLNEPPQLRPLLAAPPLFLALTRQRRPVRVPQRFQPALSSHAFTFPCSRSCILMFSLGDS